MKSIFRRRLQTMAVPFDLKFCGANLTDEKARKYFLDLRNLRDSKLQDLFLEGRKHHKNNNWKQAFCAWNSILFEFQGEQTKDLSHFQKEILAKTYLGLADFLRCGSRENESKAISYLDLAIELTNDREAKQLRKSLFLDNNIPF